MSDSSNTTFRNANCLPKLSVLIRSSIDYVCSGPIDNMSKLLNVMAGSWPGDKPLPETTLIQFIDAYIN